MTQYSGLLTMAVVAGGIVLVILLFLLFRRIARIGLALVCLLLAGVISYFIHPAAVPVVKNMYASIQEVGLNPDFQNPLLPAAGSELPNPRWVAFFVVWVVLYPVKQLLLGYSMRKLSGKK